jgi:hypothetical protein
MVVAQAREEALRQNGCDAGIAFEAVSDGCERIDSLEAASTRRDGATCLASFIARHYFDGMHPVTVGIEVEFTGSEVLSISGADCSLERMKTVRSERRLLLRAVHKTFRSGSVLPQEWRTAMMNSLLRDPGGVLKERRLSEIETEKCADGTFVTEFEDSDGGGRRFFTKFSLPRGLTRHDSKPDCPSQKEMARRRHEAEILGRFKDDTPLPLDLRHSMLREVSSRCPGFSGWTETATTLKHPEDYDVVYVTTLSGQYYSDGMHPHRTTVAVESSRAQVLSIVGEACTPLPDR